MHLLESDLNNSIYKTRMEEWKVIENYPDYEVSNMGRIKSCKRNKIRFLANRPDGSGYYQVYLLKNGVQTSFKIHRLVALTFIPNENHTLTPLVDHIDRCRTNNCVTNLRWVNKSTNILNSDRHDKEFYAIQIIGKNKDVFKVQINFRKIMTYIGCYKTLESAKKARDDFLLINQ